MNENEFVPEEVSKGYILRELYGKKSDLDLELKTTTEKREIEKRIE